MSTRYIFQLRRGTKYVDGNGNVLLNVDGTPMRDDWATYTAQENHINPLEGELVLEYELNSTTGKIIPRLKIGDGEHTFAELEYMSVDSFILPKPISVTLYADSWEPVEGTEDTYCQVVNVNNAVITPNSKVDLQLTPNQLCDCTSSGIALTAVNTDGLVTVYSVGDKFENDETISATVSEVVDYE